MYFSYGIPRGLQSIRTDWRASIYSTLIIAASFAMLGIGVLLYLNVVHISRIWLANTTVSLFLDQGISAERRQAVLERVRADPAVIHAIEVSPQEGLSQLAGKLGADHGLMNGVDPANLPYTIDFDLSVDERANIRKIAARYGALEGVGEVVYAERALEKVRLFLLVTQAVGLFFIALIVLSFLFIVSNSTKLSLHTRRDEIEILSAVGATRSVISSSFVIEGMTLSGAGFLIALGIAWVSYQLIVAALIWNPATSALGERTLFFPLTMLLPAFAAAVLLGGAGSHVSVSRMLRGIEG